MKIRKNAIAMPGVDFSFTFYHIGGWDKQQDHWDVMETREYAAFRGELKEFQDLGKEVEIYHFDLKKFYGNW
jgi:hypothetical protein